MRVIADYIKIWTKGCSKIERAEMYSVVVRELWFSCCMPSFVKDTEIIVVGSSVFSSYHNVTAIQQGSEGNRA